MTLLIRGRNAWHSTWVQHYLHNSTIYTDLESAKAGAELQRERGNVFYIEEIPALQLTGTLSKVVLCDSHPDNPFGRFNGFSRAVRPSTLGNWVGGIFPGVSVKDALATFHYDSGYWSGSEPSEHSLRTGRLPDEINIHHRRGKLSALVSQAVGVNYNLIWNQSTTANRFSTRGARAVANRWAEVLDEVSKHSETRVKDGTVSMRIYRDEVLQAIPESVWREIKVASVRKRNTELRDAREDWLSAMDEVAEISGALEIEQEELEAAREDRMRPKDTSAGIRRQRERVEGALRRIEELEKKLVDAKAKSQDLHDVYQVLSVRS